MALKPFTKAEREQVLRKLEAADKAVAAARRKGAAVSLAEVMSAEEDRSYWRLLLKRGGYDDSRAWPPVKPASSAKSTFQRRK